MRISDWSSDVCSSDLKIVLQRSEAGGEGLRIAIVDESVARAAVIEEGLREAGLTDVALLTERKGLVAHLTALEPDVVLISLENPSRDTLEESFLVSRSEEHTSELQSLMRISYAVFCLKKKKYKNQYYYAAITINI